MITKEPEFYTAIGNPLIVEVDGSGRQELTLSRTEEGTDYTLYVETFNGVGEIDISQYVKSLLKDSKSSYDGEVNLGSEQIEAYQIYRLFTPVWLNGGESRNVFMRGMYFSCEKTRTYEQTLLTRLTKIIRYRNLERFISFLPIGPLYVDIDGDELSFDGDAQISKASYKTDHISIDLSSLDGFGLSANHDITISNSPIGDNIITEDGRIALDSQRNEIVSEGTTETMGTIKRYQIEVREIPEHPFYVRWTNRYGGYDYWMFSCVHQKEWELTEQEVANKYYEDVTKASETITTFGHQYEHKVTAMAVSLDEEEFECIRDMIFADIIEVMTGINDSRYNKTWLRIYLDKASIGKMSDTPRTDVELTFKIPIL